MRLKNLIAASDNEFSEAATDALLQRCRQRTVDMLRHVRRPEAGVGVVSSPLGDLLVAVTGRGLVFNHYLVGEDDLARTVQKLRSHLDLVADQRAVYHVGMEIRRYLSGDRQALRQAVDLSLAVTPFQQRILRELQEVPHGAVISYQALAEAAGAPRGARAVGNAMHDNPVPVYVPCHRVIASGGGLGGYGGGALRKVQLLRSEGFDLNPGDRRLPPSTVWAHQSTRIYCRASCPTAKRVSPRRILLFADARTARESGMRPCRICRPD